jgi:ceramide glucosyltransferase
MSLLIVLLALGLLAMQIWKHLMVIAFFHRPIPVARTNPTLVSILQPIVSGDPTLADCLAQALTFECSYPVELIWLLDAGDGEAHALCRELSARLPARPVRVVVPPAAGTHENPKMVKLIAGARVARGDVICVLDDDTQLPDHGLEQCLPFLDEPGVGLAFGLPYYLSFQNLWSRLIAYFVNSNSLLTYVPYTALIDPLTINGMFYAIRRTVLDAAGGFDGLERTLSDDFAVAQRFRLKGYTLRQTPLRHGISTWVKGPRHYFSLIQRWLVFPRESLMRHLPLRGLAVLYLLAMLPAFFPLLLAIATVAFPSPAVAGLAVAYFVHSYLIFAHFNAAYLTHVAPWRHSWLVPLIQLILPLQLLVALLGPPQVVWRGKLMRIERGGGFQIVDRRVE